MSFARTAISSEGAVARAQVEKTDDELEAHVGRLRYLPH